jgi:hypothetical protein
LRLRVWDFGPCRAFDFFDRANQVEGPHDVRPSTFEQVPERVDLYARERIESRELSLVREADEARYGIKCRPLIGGRQRSRPPQACPTNASPKPDSRCCSTTARRAPDPLLSGLRAARAQETRECEAQYV